MKNYFLILKSLFIVVAFVFCCSAVYAEEVKKECELKIQMTGGKTIKTGIHIGEIGYAWAEIDEGERTINGVRYYWCYIDCNGKGVTPCPKQQGSCSPGHPNIEDEITAIVHNAINMGEIAGEFVHEKFLCKWNNGEKNTDEETGIPIYGYELTITSEENRTPEDLTISVFPNPVQNYLNVQFSIDIDAQMFVKIIDLEGNTRWEADIYIPGRDLQIDILESVVPTGVYFINCTNNDYTASTSFVKQ